MSEMAPLTETFEVVVAAVPTAGNDLTTTLFEAPFAGTITEVGYVTPTAITGAATNNRKTSLINKGQAGLGSTEMAALQYVSGVNTVAFDKKVIPLSGTPANLVVAAGDVIAWESLHILTGIADPGGTVIVKVTRS